MMNDHPVNFLDVEMVRGYDVRFGGIEFGNDCVFPWLVLS